MALQDSRHFLRFGLNYLNSFSRVRGFRNFSTTVEDAIDEQAAEPDSHVLMESRKTIIPENYRFRYPEFLPDPFVEHRNSVREKLERIDMINRRKNVELPEFYVGSILAVTTSDAHTPGKNKRFVGICIQRLGCGLRATFILRNVVDNQGVEFKYALYGPVIQKIEVLKLEKRLDNELFYLRDAPPEYSTFSFDMEPEFHSEGQPVPINTLKVPLNPRPWLLRYERMDLQGATITGLPERFYKRAEEVATPWVKYDLMEYYRKTVPEEEQMEVFSEVYSQLQDIEQKRKKTKRRKAYAQPSSTAK